MAPKVLIVTMSTDEEAQIRAAAASASAAARARPAVGVSDAADSVSVTVDVSCAIVRYSLDFLTGAVARATAVGGRRLDFARTSPQLSALDP